MSAQLCWHLPQCVGSSPFDTTPLENVQRPQNTTQSQNIMPEVIRYAFRLYLCVVFIPRNSSVWINICDST